DMDMNGMDFSKFGGMGGGDMASMMGGMGGDMGDDLDDSDDEEQEVTKDSAKATETVDAKPKGADSSSKAEDKAA
ncbi:hypothetical protein SGI37_20130, partial [Providencia rettgeri]